MLQALAVKEGALDRDNLYVRLCPMLFNRRRELKSHLDTAPALFPQNPTLHMYEQVVPMDGDIRLCAIWAGLDQMSRCVELLPKPIITPGAGPIARPITADPLLRLVEHYLLKPNDHRRAIVYELLRELSRTVNSLCPN